MNRIIKFRAWDTINKKWLWHQFEKYTSDTHEDKPQDVRQGRFWLTPTWTENSGQVHFMQFIGLLDKAGKEAYGSDIVKVFHYADPEKYSLAVIGWDEKYACFDLQWVDKETHAYRIGVYPFEIIGNIYEHPTLIPNQ